MAIFFCPSKSSELECVEYIGVMNTSLSALAITST